MTDWKLIARAINDSSVKITRDNWENDYSYFSGERWLTKSGNDFDLFDYSFDGWIEYVEPKKKLKLWQWAHKPIGSYRWELAFGGMFRENAAGCDAVKIEGSMVEVDE